MTNFGDDAGKAQAMLFIPLGDSPMFYDDDDGGPSTDKVCWFGFSQRHHQT